jgi:anti-sigma B factor antagonist
MGGDRDLGVLESSDDQASLVAVSGEIDLSSTGELAAVLESAESSAPTLLQIDLSAVSFMDSQGLRLLIEAHKRAIAADRRFVIVNPSSVVRRLFEVSGVDQILDVMEAEQ